MEWHYSEDRKQIILDQQPSRFKYITGTRLASILGLNEYSTPFKIWCECTRLVTPPFEDTVYTMFGKINESKQREFVAQKFPNVVGPEEYFGGLYDTVRWNFFDEKYKPFAGLWDAVCTKNNKKDITAVIEFKTASSPVKWCDNQVPVSYALQGALYAKLLGLDRVMFVVSFPDKLDYAHPEDFTVTPENTKIIIKKLNEMFFEVDGEYLDINGCMEKAKKIWQDYIQTGISPEFDEVLDKEYLDIIRKSKPSNDTSLDALCLEGINLAKKIAELKVSSCLTALEKDLKLIESSIKQTLMDKNLDGCGKYKLNRKIDMVFDEKTFAKEHQNVYDKYCVEKVSYKLSKDLKEEDE